MNTGWKRWLHKCLRDTALFAHHTSDWEPRVKQLTRLTPGLQLSSQSQITTGKHWMGRSQQGRKERASIDNGQAGICGSYSRRPTLMLNEKLVDKHGSEVTYRSVVTSAPAAIRFSSLRVS